MEKSTNSQQADRIAVQQITPPTGGGAVKGIGDSFKANLYSGSGAYSIPIPIKAARGFEPALAVNYSSGAGNSVFGLGFSLFLPSITISTRLKTPQYDGNSLYLFNGDELVKRESTVALPNPYNASLNGKPYLVTAFLLRVQNSYPAIEQWQEQQTGITFWKVVAANNTTSLFGQFALSRIFNPEAPTQICEWLIDESVDTKGNKIQYTYKAEDNESVPHTVYELNRNYNTNRYIYNIRYGNYFDSPGNEKFMFTVSFNYGEDTTVAPSIPWQCRPDPYSTYNNGFEIRTYRLCNKIQLINDFPTELGGPVIVNEMNFYYTQVQQYGAQQLQTVSLLSKVIITGFKKAAAGNIEQSQLPALEFSYSAFEPPASPLFKPLNVNGGNIPGYLNAGQYLPVDLNGDGLPGFLYTGNNSVLYFEPCGNGNYNYPVSDFSFPVNKGLQGRNITLTDIDGNGELELLVNSATGAGYYLRTTDNEWNSFVPLQNSFNNIQNPEIEWCDLDGDGKSDLMLADTDNIQVYNSLGKEGYGASKILINENNIPLVRQGYPKELVTFANIFGDGLSHRVKISNGSVECWPCLGYGRFGAKVTLGNPPVFGDNFDTSRLFVTDIDGSGTADIAYVHNNRVEIFINLGGNFFSDAIVVYLPDEYTALDQISFSDILGNGTNCLVFTKITPAPAHYYYNFIGSYVLPDGTQKQSLKPYLLYGINNNTGSVSFINYASSTKFYLQDKFDGQPWATKLSFPVQVVEEVINYDLLSKTRYVSKYKYHNGFYDTVERQFRGFGMAESWDSETYQDFSQSYLNPDFPVNALNAELFVPPVHTKTWYLNGAWGSEYEKLLAQYKGQYFNKDTQAYPFPDNVIDNGVYNSNGETVREAFAVLAGMVLRTETYADDGTQQAAKPYTVEQSNYNVVLVQPAANGQYAVFRVEAREGITYQYDRVIDDPRVSQVFSLETDPLCGQVKRLCNITLPRRNAVPPLLYPEQYVLHATINTTEYFNTAEGSAFRLRGVAYDSQGFEMLGFNPSAAYCTFDEVKTAANNALQNIVPYGGPVTPGTLQAQQLSRQRSYFWDINQLTVLPLGNVSQRALLHHVSVAEFTNANIGTMYNQRLAATTVADMGGFIYDSATGYWENQGLIQNYYNTPNSFYQPSGTQSSSATVGMENSVTYDAYYLHIVKVQQTVAAAVPGGAPAIVNETTALIDYQALAPYQITDINKNVSQLLFDALGQVTVMSLFGTENGVPAGGMRLYAYNGLPAQYVERKTAPNGNPVTFADVIDSANYEYFLQGAVSYFYYDLNAFVLAAQPLNAIKLMRKNFYVEPAGISAFLCLVIVTYTDGLGRTLEQKQKTEPVGGVDKWIVSGRSVYNNKGSVCESYVPYFSNIPLYETQDDIANNNLVPPPTVTHYDAIERVVRIDTPKGFFSTIEYSPWQQKLYDEDDTITDSVYYINFMANYPINPTPGQQDEKDALDKAAAFYKTPTTSILDNKGAVIRNIQIVDGRQIATFYKVDVASRVLEDIDPRLYTSNLTKGTNYYSHRYLYTMSGEKPLVTDSADAGLQMFFNNIFGNQVWAFSARSYCQVTYYDWLQRKLQLKVQKITTTGPVSSFAGFNLVEVFTYGEQPGLPANQNLRGHVYQIKDLTGIVLNYSYDLLGKSLQTSRQIVADYKAPADWNTTVQLEPEIYTVKCTYNALGQPVTETTPDNAVTTNYYNTEGLLSAIELADNTGATQTVISQITYNANRQRLLVKFGNGVATQYQYDAATLRLTAIVSNRAAPASQNVQNISYYYDAVGNVTRCRDTSIDTVFNKNQQVTPVFDYTYDSIYRLCKSTGRQHPGINADTYKNNKVDNSFKQSMFTQLPVSNAQAIENYSEIYSYDDSGNLVKKQHTASTSFTVLTPVLDNCNRLQGLQYDDSGNQRQLTINNMVALDYNCCENLVSATVIQRPTEPDDADYYLYDSNEMRTRKVTELYAGAGNTTYEDKIYIGSFEVKRTGAIPSTGSRTVTTERQTLKVMDGSGCILIIYTWVKGAPPAKAKKAPLPNQWRYQLGNNLGSIALELANDASLISYEEYFAYGGTAIITGSNQSEVSLKEYRYNGKERDDSTGLYYYGARYYIPWLGRWLKPDPAGTVDGLNLYAYVKGSPVTNTDPDGLAKKAAAKLPPAKRSRKEKHSEDSGSESDDEAGSDSGSESGSASPPPVRRCTAAARRAVASEVVDAVKEEYGPLLVKHKQIHSSVLYKFKEEVEVAPNRTMSPERLLVRHIATTLLDQVPGATEVQAAISHADKTIYVASNSKEAEVSALLPASGLLKDIAVPAREGRGIREARHMTKLLAEQAGDYRDYSMVFVPGINEQHAETKIVEAGKAFDYIGGTRRPCFSCSLFFAIKGVGVAKYNPHTGPFWSSIAGQISLSESRRGIKGTGLRPRFYRTRGLAKKDWTKYDSDSE